MNILYLTTHVNVGGITSYLRFLSAGMVQKGHTVCLASSTGTLVPEFQRQGVRFVPVPIKTKSIASPKVLMSACMLYSYLKKNRIDIIHANTRVTQVLACILSRLCGVPYLSTCHGFFKARFLRRRIPCWGFRVIAISESVRQHLIEDLKVEPQLIRLVYSGIDTEVFSAQRGIASSVAKQALGLGEGPVIGIIARLSDVKGHLYLIQAMKDVVQEFPRAQLLIVGEGRMKKELVALTRSLGLLGRVVFLPHTEDVAATLSLLDVFVMPSLKEGLGLGLMEAMAAGVAVVGSAVGGIKDLIQDGHNGLLVEPANPGKLAEAICGLLKDEGRRRRMGANACDLIRQRFSVNKMVDQTEGVYTECLNVA
ncbi:MAG: glycosyltransferase family 4 protein [Candidatus Omnitrophica bacterium]|nr:glycosyltransferase family 4 protein [Candidatus Omnitrophota bacterium]